MVIFNRGYEELFKDLSLDYRVFVCFSLLLIG